MEQTQNALCCLCAVDSNSTNLLKSATSAHLEDLSSLCFVLCGSYSKRTRTPQPQNQRTTSLQDHLFLLVINNKRRSPLEDLRGSCTVSTPSRQLSLPPPGSVRACRPQLSESLNDPPESRRAALPGLQCAGSPSPNAPFPAGPQGASAPSLAPAEQSFPGFAAPAGDRWGAERSGEWARGRRAERRAGEVKGRQHFGGRGEAVCNKTMFRLKSRHFF